MQLREVGTEVSIIIVHRNEVFIPEVSLHFFSLKFLDERYLHRRRRGEGGI